jgi:hypothetical protein
MPTQDEGQQSASGCLLRLFWLFLGNGVLGIAAAKLALHPRGWFASLDAIYWVAVALLVAARYADIRYFRGTTAEGAPATLADWRRYAFILVLSAGVVWLAVHFLGAFTLAR